MQLNCETFSIIFPNEWWSFEISLYIWLILIEKNNLLI